MPESNMLRSMGTRPELTEEWLRTALASNGGGVIVTDLNRRVMLLNRAAEELTGWKETEAVGRPLGDVFRIINEETREPAKDPVVRVLTTGKVEALANHTVLISRDGREIPIAGSAAPIKLSDGTVTGVVLVFRDQTRERQAEREAQKARELAEGIVDAVRYPLLILDANLRVVSANRSFYRTFKVTPEETVGRLLFDLGKRQWDIPDLRELLETVLSQNTTLDDFEVQLDFETTSRRVMFLNARRIYRKGNNTEMILLTIEDFTERKQMEEALRQSEEKYRGLFENAEVGMFRSRLDGSGFIAVNRRFAEIFGFTREEMLGSPPTMRWADPGAREEMLRVLRERGELRDYEADMVTKGGETRTVLMSIRLYSDEGYLEGTMIDITDRKRLEEEVRQHRDRLDELVHQLNETVEELERSNKELEQFVYVASHDLQEPLRMVASYTELLADRYQDKLDEKAHKYIRYAVDGARRMQVLINDLLALSRVGTKGRPPEPTDCGEVLAGVLKSLEKTIKESSAEIVIGDLPTVMADPGQIGQVFQNLISNSIKFRSEAPPRIEVTARRKGTFWEICVADNGIGIDPEFHDRIFTIFQRLHGQGKYPGSGIGLAIVKKIVERHGGQVRVESAAGQGARFIFTLPAADSEGREENA